MNTENRMLEVDTDENNKKIYDVDKEVNKMQKAIRRRKQKNCKYRELSLRVIEVKNLKTNIRNKIDALKQKISNIEEVKDEVKLKIKLLKKKIEKLPIENPFDFTEYVENQNEENEMDLGLFFEFAEDNKIIYHQKPLNILKENMEKLKN